MQARSFLLLPQRPSNLNLKRRILTAHSNMAASTLRPASRVATQPKDVWSMVNEAAETSNVTPVINLGQGFFGYNPPQFVIDAAKQALDKVDCNQYSPTRGRPRLRKAIAEAYSPYFGRE